MIYDGSATLVGCFMSEEDLDKIMKLKSLLDADLITREDFARQKAKILGGLGAPSTAKATGKARSGQAAAAPEPKGPSFMSVVKKRGLARAMKEALGFVD